LFLGVGATSCMPKLPAVKDRELIRVLKKLGFFEHGERGTPHLVLSHHDGRRTVISRHPGKDIPRGTLQGILRDIGVSADDLVALLKK